MSEEKKESEVEAKPTEEAKSEEPSAEEVKKTRSKKISQSCTKAAEKEANAKAVADAEAAVKEALEKAKKLQEAELEASADEEYKAIAAEVKADTAKKVDYTFKRQGEEIFRREMGEPEFWLEKEDRFPRPIFPQMNKNLSQDKLKLLRIKLLHIIHNMFSVQNMVVYQIMNVV